MAKRVVIRERRCRWAAKWSVGYVPDVDEAVARAVEAGAEILVPLQDQFWGDRIAWLMDPSGHVWTVASRIEETTAAERTARWERIRTQAIESASEDPDPS